MTEHTVRLYAAAIGLVVFFLFWAAIAARPWAATGDADPRSAVIERREQQLARDTRRVNRVVKRRFTVYAKRLARRKRAISRRERENAATLVAAPSGSAGATSSAGASVASAPSAPAVSVTAAPPVTTTSSS